MKSLPNAAIYFYILLVVLQSLYKFEVSACIPEVILPILAGVPPGTFFTRNSNRFHYPPGMNPQDPFFRNLNRFHYTIEIDGGLKMDNDDNRRPEFYLRDGKKPPKYKPPQWWIDMHLRT